MNNPNQFNRVLYQHLQTDMQSEKTEPSILWYIKTARATSTIGAETNTVIHIQVQQKVNIFGQHIKTRNRKRLFVGAGLKMRVKKAVLVLPDVKQSFRWPACYMLA